MPPRDLARDQFPQLFLRSAPLVAFDGEVLEQELVAESAVPGRGAGDVARGAGDDFAGRGDGGGEGAEGVEGGEEGGEAHVCVVVIVVVAVGVGFSVVRFFFVGVVVGCKSEIAMWLLRWMLEMGTLDGLINCSGEQRHYLSSEPHSPISKDDFGLL